MMIRLTEIHDDCYVYISTQHIIQIHPRGAGSSVYAFDSPVLEVHEKPADIAMLCGNGYVATAYNRSNPYTPLTDEEGNTLLRWYGK
jgi:hypothetical protein